MDITELLHTDAQSPLGCDNPDDIPLERKFEHDPDFNPPVSGLMTHLQNWSYPSI